MSLVELLGTTVDDNGEWTEEEVTMLQYLMLDHQSKNQVTEDADPIKALDINVQDVSMEHKPSDECQVKQEVGTSANVWLSPIHEETNMIESKLFDPSKDAVAAFCTEKLDPFDKEALSKLMNTLQNEEPSDVAPVIQELRDKIKELDRLYYTRYSGRKTSHKAVISGAETHTLRTKLALDRLERVARGLAQHNTDLSVRIGTLGQRPQRSDSESLDTFVAGLDYSEIHAMLQQDTQSALAFEMQDDSSRAHTCGWSHSTSVASDGRLRFSCSKEYERERALNLKSMTDKTWMKLQTSPDNATAYEMRKLDDTTVVMMYEIPSRDKMRIDRSLAVLHRIQVENGELIGLRSVNPESKDGNFESEDKRWMEGALWLKFYKDQDGQVQAASLGQIVFPTQDEAKAASLELICDHVRWETEVVSPLFGF